MKAGILIQSGKLNSFDFVCHGFGVRGKTVPEYLDALEIKDRFLVDTDQVHGNTVHCLMYPARPRNFSAGVGCSNPALKGDAFITDRPGMVCFVRTADCVPVLIADPKRRVVGAVHAGWRGIVGGVIPETIKAMKAVYGSDAGDCVAAIGPHICKKCFEVGSEVVDEFRKKFSGDFWLNDEKHIDLNVSARSELVHCGVDELKIDDLAECTYCSERFNSFRRDNSENERQFNFIIILGSDD